MSGIVEISDSPGGKEMSSNDNTNNPDANKPTTTQGMGNKPPDEMPPLPAETPDPAREIPDSPNEQPTSPPEPQPIQLPEQPPAQPPDEVNKQMVAADGAEIKPIPKRKTLSIVIHDAGVLRAAYMQFIKGGGLFIPTAKPFNMGDDTNLVIRLLDEEEPYRVNGKVVWITPTSIHSNRAAGIGVEFSEDKNGDKLRSKIELILGPHLKSVESTHTM